MIIGGHTVSDPRFKSDQQKDKIEIISKVEIISEASDTVNSISVF